MCWECGTSRSVSQACPCVARGWEATSCRMVRLAMLLFVTSLSLGGLFSKATPGHWLNLILVNLLILLSSKNWKIKELEIVLKLEHKSLFRAWGIGRSKQAEYPQWPKASHWHMLGTRCSDSFQEGSSLLPSTRRTRNLLGFTSNKCDRMGSSLDTS